MTTQLGRARDGEQGEIDGRGDKRKGGKLARKEIKRLIKGRRGEEEAEREMEQW